MLWVPQSEIGSTCPRPTCNPHPGYRRNAAAAVGPIPGIEVTILSTSARTSRTSEDRTSWLNFKNVADQTLQFEGNPILFEPFGNSPASPASHAHVKAGLAVALADWKT